jgi:hypothetical protein
MWLSLSSDGYVTYVAVETWGCWILTCVTVQRRYTALNGTYVYRIDLTIVFCPEIRGKLVLQMKTSSFRENGDELRLVLSARMSSYLGKLLYVDWIKLDQAP